MAFRIGQRLLQANLRATLRKDMIAAREKVAIDEAFPKIISLLKEAAGRGESSVELNCTFNDGMCLKDARHDVLGDLETRLSEEGLYAGWKGQSDETGPETLKVCWMEDGEDERNLVVYLD